jgi:uncharacterized membrane protein (DUF2068 family)
MKELISESQAEWIVAGLCLAVFVLGAWGAWRKTRSTRPTIFFAALGPLLYALWRVYNAIEDHYGLDSVRALVINAVIILGAGVVLPFVYSAFCGRASSKTRK